jgi:nicotinate-nucleotide adenylyltransferase
LNGRRLAIFGGTFDPIHNAHLAIGRAAADRFQLDRVLFIPAARPPHKSGITHAPFEDRMRMVELAVEGEPRFEASRLEEGTERSYSIGTIEKLRARMSPEDELFFIIGADAFSEIRTWHRWKDVARAVRFIVVSRPGYECDAPAEVRFDRLDSLDLPVSSSDIRRAFAMSAEPREVPPRVADYIRAHGLYRAPIRA